MSKKTIDIWDAISQVKDVVKHHVQVTDVEISFILEEDGSRNLHCTVFHRDDKFKPSNFTVMIHTDDDQSISALLVHVKKYCVVNFPIPDDKMTYTTAL